MKCMYVSQPIHWSTLNFRELLILVQHTLRTFICKYSQQSLHYNLMYSNASLQNMNITEYTWVHHSSNNYEDSCTFAEMGYILEVIFSWLNIPSPKNRIRQDKCNAISTLLQGISDKHPLYLYLKQLSLLPLIPMYLNRTPAIIKG